MWVYLAGRSIRANRCSGHCARRTVSVRRHSSDNIADALEVTLLFDWIGRSALKLRNAVEPVIIGVGYPLRDERLNHRLAQD